MEKGKREKSSRKKRKRGINMEKQRGFYSYKKEDVNIRMKYSIEFTRSKKVYEHMEKGDFDFNELDKREFNYLEDAFLLWNTLFYDESVLHLAFFEQVILNDEVILEQFKENTLYTVLSKITRNRIEAVENMAAVHQEENKILKEFLKEYNIDADEVIRKARCGE